MHRRLIWSAAICVFAAATLQAGTDLPDTQLAKRGKLLISEDLAKAPADVIADFPLTKMKSGWKLWSGEWKFADDAMKGTQLASDKRGAVAACVFPFTDAIFQFDVRLDDCRQVRFRFQDSTPEHICSVMIAKNGFSAQKDDHDHGGPDKAESFGNLSFALPAALRAHQRAGPPNPWHTVLVEIVGTKMNVNIDGLNILGGHPLIGSQKAFFDFVVSGGSGSFRNLRVWEALPQQPKE